MDGSGALRLGMALAALAALQGCVAAAIPVLAGAAIAKKQTDGSKTGGSRQSDASAPPPELRKAVFVGEEAPKASLIPTAVTPMTTAAPAPAAPKLYTVTDTPPNTITTSLVEMTTVTKGAFIAPPPATVQLAPAQLTALAPDQEPAQSATLPAPSADLVPPKAKPAMAKAATLPAAPAPIVAGGKSSGYLGLTAYALSRANSPTADAVLDVIDVSDPLGDPRRAQCGKLQPAVMIDLDPALEVFNPASASPQPGLAEALSALRAAGITVMWSSALPVEQAEKVHAALARTGLDANRTDRLLLLNGPGDRKQARRLSAMRNWCVVAMAGDRRGDFDEVFDYLKDADTQIPADRLFGDGWFIAPAPLP